MPHCWKSHATAQLLYITWYKGGLLYQIMFTNLSIPFSRSLCFFERRALPPQAPSTCIQRPYFSQISAISSRGSYAPRTVVPAVAFTK